MVHQDMIIVDMKITMCIFNQFELDPNSASSSAHIQNQIIVVKTRLFFLQFSHPFISPGSCNLFPISATSQNCQFLFWNKEKKEEG